MTTYKKLTWDSYKIQVESAVRDGNGATISTTYATKTELTTGLGNKLDTTAAASTYLSKTDAASTYAPLTKLTDGSVTKVGTANVGTDTKPIKLVGGVPTAVTNDLVDTATAQTIKGAKSFIPASGSGIVTVGIDAGDSSTARTNGTVVIKTNAGDRAYLNNYEDASNIITQLTSIGNIAQSFEIISNKTSNEGFSKTPYRAYNSANIYDIVTIGSLAANPNVVHTVGVETLNGLKFLNDGLYQNTGNYINSYTSGTDSLFRMRHDAVTPDVYASLELRINENDGTTLLFLQKRKKSDDTYLGGTVIATL